MLGLLARVGRPDVCHISFVPGLTGLPSRSPLSYTNTWPVRRISRDFFHSSCNAGAWPASPWAAHRIPAVRLLALPGQPEKVTIIYESSRNLSGCNLGDRGNPACSVQRPRPLRQRSGVGRLGRAGCHRHELRPDPKGTKGQRDTITAMKDSLALLFFSFSFLAGLERLALLSHRKTVSITKKTLRDVEKLLKSGERLANFFGRPQGGHRVGDRVVILQT